MELPAFPGQKIQLLNDCAPNDMSLCHIKVIAMSVRHYVDVRMPGSLSRIGRWTSGMVSKPNELQPFAIVIDTRD